MRRICLLLSVTAAVACGGSPTAPPSPSPSPSPATIVGLRIVGLPQSLPPGGTAQLGAKVEFAGGTTKTCEAAWSVDAPAVAQISASGLLTGIITGYVNVAATCSALRASVEAKVSAPSPYTLILLPQDAEVPSEAGVASQVEILDGDRAGQTFTAGSAFTNGVSGFVWPVKVRLTAEMFEPKEVVLAESTGTRRNKTSPLFDFYIPMTFTGGPGTVSYVRQMTREQMEFAHPFEPVRAGSVRVRTWWSVDYNDRLTVALWCGGTLRHSITQLFGSAGAGFSYDLGAAEPCEIRLRQSKSDAATRYRVAITYPH